MLNSFEQRLCSYLMSATFWSVTGIIHTKKPLMQRSLYISSVKKKIFLNQTVSWPRTSQI